VDEGAPFVLLSRLTSPVLRAHHGARIHEVRLTPAEGLAIGRSCQKLVQRHRLSLAPSASSAMLTTCSSARTPTTRHASGITPSAACRVRARACARSARSSFPMSSSQAYSPSSRNLLLKSTSICTDPQCATWLAKVPVATKHRSILLWTSNMPTGPAAPISSIARIARSPFLRMVDVAT